MICRNNNQAKQFNKIVQVIKKKRIEIFTRTAEVYLKIYSKQKVARQIFPTFRKTPFKPLLIHREKRKQ
jgi:hypothetical protein